MAPVAQKAKDDFFSLDMPFEETMQRIVRVNTKDLERVAPVIENGAVATPFVKWVGGKRGIIAELKKYAPAEFNDYYEPFIGGGALFFELRSKIKNATLIDSNIDLVFTYTAVRDNVEKLISLLQQHAIDHNKEHYYEVRSQHTLTDPTEIAARLIYLNKTCYNGLYRVNSKGEFNVPMGSYTDPAIVQESNLRACSKALQGIKIEVGDFTRIKPKSGDFVYFDPPYHPVSETANFTGYGTFGFNEKDQERLRDFLLKLHGEGVKIMLSNSNTPLIRKLFKKNPFRVNIVNAPRLVNCKPNKRGSVEEVLITNY